MGTNDTGATPHQPGGSFAQFMESLTKYLEDGQKLANSSSWMSSLPP
jgi:hypothetical protein